MVIKRFRVVWLIDELESKGLGCHCDALVKGNSVFHSVYFLLKLIHVILSEVVFDGMSFTLVFFVFLYLDFIFDLMLLN